MKYSIWIRRIYLPPRPSDGYRVLVDRLWPRGLPKAEAQVDEWARDVAPSDALRQWFAHDLHRWEPFQERYRAELHGRPDELARLAVRARRGRLTLLFAARDEAHNNAVVLREVLAEMNMAGRGGPDG